MKLEYCRYLLEINRLHSISAAARSLHIGQTTLSAVVKHMEEQVGFSIFQRTPAGVSATATGERLMELLWEINVKYEELLRIKQRDFGNTPSVTVLIASSISVRLALPLAARFSDFDVQGNLVLEDVPSDTIFEQILQSNASIGLTYSTDAEIQEVQQDAQSSVLQIERLLEDELCALVPKQHRLAERDYLDAGDLAKEPVIAVGPARSGRKDKVLGNLSACGLHTHLVSNFDDMYQVIRKHNLVGFAPKFVGEYGYEHAFRDFKLLPLRNTENENKMYICLVTYKNRKMRYQENIVASCIREYFRDLK